MKLCCLVKTEVHCLKCNKKWCWDHWAVRREEDHPFRSFDSPGGGSEDAIMCGDNTLWWRKTTASGLMPVRENGTCYIC